MPELIAIRENFRNMLSKLYDQEEIDHLFYTSLAECLEYNNLYFHLHPHENIMDEQYLAMEKVLQRLEEGEPLQYILEKAWFMGIPFKVNPQVLIPRPETEELVDLIIHDQEGSAELKIIDIGTGSGCIPVALKKHLPQAEITALDVSKGALELARHNALANQVSIDFMLSDILEWDLVFPTDQLFDVIVSNPPYITPDEQGGMHPNVLQYEPHLALFVEGQAPLLFYETIASFALQHLLPGGYLYFEINRRYGPAVQDLLVKKGFDKVEVLQDMQEADRMVRAFKKGEG